MLKKQFLILLVISFTSLFAQEIEGDFEVIQGKYRDFYLSMTVDECNDALMQDGYFEYQDPSLPSLLQASEETLLDCPGRNYIKRGWFQFQSDKLTIITIQLNEERVDYYSLYTQLTSKYGNPDEINPNRALWINEEDKVEMELSRPLQIKYRDRAFFEELIEEGRERESYEEILRERFLEEF